MTRRPRSASSNRRTRWRRERTKRRALLWPRWRFHAMRPCGRRRQRRARRAEPKTWLRLRCSSSSRQPLMRRQRGRMRTALELQHRSRRCRYQHSLSPRRRRRPPSGSLRAGRSVHHLCNGPAAHQRRTFAAMAWAHSQRGARVPLTTCPPSRRVLHGQRRRRQRRQCRPRRPPFPLRRLMRRRRRRRRRCRCRQCLRPPRQLSRR